MYLDTAWIHHGRVGRALKGHSGVERQLEREWKPASMALRHGRISSAQEID